MRKFRKENIRKLYYKIKNTMCMLPIIVILLQNKVFATSTGSISTAEVNQATENIKNAVIKLAMPIRWNFSFCKYCNHCTKDDS